MDGPFQPNNTENSAWNHMTQIELNASYIHAQYRTTLKRLHEEIDCLKSVNRDLQFQLILLHQTKSAGTTTTIPANRMSTSGQNSQGSDRVTSHACSLAQNDHTSATNVVSNLGPNSQNSGVFSVHGLSSNQHNEVGKCSDFVSNGRPPITDQTNTSSDCSNLDKLMYKKDVRLTENSAQHRRTETPEDTFNKNIDGHRAKEIAETCDSPRNKTAEDSSTGNPATDKTVRSPTKERPKDNLATDRSMRSPTKDRSEGTLSQNRSIKSHPKDRSEKCPAQVKFTECPPKESQAFELDCTSKHCSLKMRCDQCQSYTPLTITKLTPHSKVKSLLNEICSSYNNRFANSSNHTDNRENQPLATISQISNHHYSTNQNQDNRTAALSLRASQTQLYPTNQAQLYPSSSLTQLYPTNQTQLYPSSSQPQLYPTNQNFHTANQSLSPVVHKTYVLSIEDTDPNSTNKKIQKTIVWSKRQTGTFESDGTSETPCILPPLQHWQESRCAPNVRQIQPSTTTLTLPEIVTKK